MSERHSHTWVPATVDGAPRFSIRVYAELAMPVLCCECGADGWITRDAWDSLREATEAAEA